MSVRSHFRMFARPIPEGAPVGVCDMVRATSGRPEPDRQCAALATAADGPVADVPCRSRGDITLSLAIDRWDDDGGRV